MVIISRAISESVEIFPYSVNKFIVETSTRWAYAIAPIIDRVYRGLGYPLAPDVSIIRKLPVENPKYPLCVWMVSLWTFSVIYTFTYWTLSTLTTYSIGRILGGRGSLLRLFTLIGIAHIPMVNWWFYVGCEMMYEIVEQEIYLNLLPPYYGSAVKTVIHTPWGNLPTLVPIEGFWLGLGFGVGFALLTLLLLYGFVKLELGLSKFKTLVTIAPLVGFIVFIVVGAFNIDEIVHMLDGYVKEGLAWKWTP